MNLVQLTNLVWFRHPVLRVSVLPTVLRSRRDHRSRASPRSRLAARGLGMRERRRYLAARLTGRSPRRSVSNPVDASLSAYRQSIRYIL